MNAQVPVLSYTSVRFLKGLQKIAGQEAGAISSLIYQFLLVP